MLSEPSPKQAFQTQTPAIEGMKLYFSLNESTVPLGFILFGACSMDVGGVSWFRSSLASYIRFLISFLVFMVTGGHGIAELGAM